MRIKDIIRETTAGGIAGVAMGLGGGDPAASIYHTKTTRKKKAKMIKRAPMENNDDKTNK